jgi:hypothetical protein
MRVLWVDADENPWTDAGGWQLLEEFGLKVQRVPTVPEARGLVEKKEFDLVLVRAELKDAPGLLVFARKLLEKDVRKIVLASSEWTKEQFKLHSKTEGAAHRYARIPMPPEGFLGLVADLFDCTVEELTDFTLAEGVADRGSGKASGRKVPADAPRRPRKRANPPAAESEDVEVLRKYLRIKEEQLEISEGEREELALENERFQSEAHHLQLKLRELEHLHDELSRKLQQMEEDKQGLAREKQRETEERERLERAMGERIRGLEGQVAEAGEKYENLRVRVRKDIRKIRENERDLEARLELLRKDSETLLQARDEKVLELQRKLDALEFDLDQVQDGRVQAQMEAERYLAKLSRVARALHIAVGMIEEDHVSEEELDSLEPVLGGAANAEDSPEQAAPPAEPGAGAETPAGEGEAPAEELEPLPEDLAALAEEGEPTQMIGSEGLENLGEEPESSSG